MPAFRFRRHVIAACAGLALGGLVRPTPAQVTYTVTALGGPGTQATALSDAGTLAGLVLLPDGIRGFVAGSSGFFPIDGTDSWYSTYPYAINNYGDVAFIYPDAKAAARWSGGVATLLPPITPGRATWFSAAVSINNAGDLGGEACDSSGCHGVIWGKDGSVQSLPGTSWVWALNNRGQALSTGPAGLQVWQSGVATTLAAPSGTTTYGGGLNDNGVVVGEIDRYEGSGPAVQSVLWKGGGYQVLDTGPGDSHASRVNNAEQVLGRAESCGGTQDYLWSAAGGMRCVSSIEATQSLAGASVSGLNNWGQMAATLDGQAVLLTPTGTLNWQGSSGASFVDGSSWDSGLGLAPSRFLDVKINPDAAVNVVLPAVYTEAKTLTVGAGLGKVTLTLQDGAQLATVGGVSIQGNGSLTGSGIIVGGLTSYYGTVRPGSLLQVSGGFLNEGYLMAGGTLAANLDNRGFVTVNAGEKLVLQPGPQLGFIGGVGLIGNASGGSDSAGGIGGMSAGSGPGSGKVGGGSGGGSGGAQPPAPVGVVNIADSAIVHVNTGAISVNGGTLEVHGALKNDVGLGLNVAGGDVSFQDGVLNAAGINLSGVVNFNGPLQNLGTGVVSIAAGAQVVFGGNLTNTGLIQMQGNGQATFTGVVDGTGTMVAKPGLRGYPTSAAVLRFQGQLNPGLGIGSMTVGNSVFAGRVTMELGGSSSGSYDHLDIVGNLSFATGSLLQLSLADGYSPTAGSRYALFGYTGTRSGRFAALDLPTLGDGLAWDLSQLYTSGVVSVSSVPEPGAWLLMLAGLLPVLRRPACGFFKRQIVEE